MKNLSYSFHLFLILILFSTYSCVTPNGFNPEKDIIAKMLNEKAVLTISEATLEQAVKSANDEISALTEYEFKFLTHPETEEEVLFLMVYTKLRSGGSHLIALDLVEHDSDATYLINMGSSSNTCTGFCCSKCVWSQGGRAYWHCWCNSPSCENEARCDHSTSSLKSSVIQAVEE